MQSAIQKALDLAGNQRKLADVIGISAQALGVQLRAGRIRPEHCITIENAFPGQISRYELDPDHFGKAAPSADCVVIVLQNFQTTTTTV
ncbi:MAG: YdaS family helix-turn-helix protein [Pseudomonadota bacterium]